MNSTGLFKILTLSFCVFYSYNLEGCCIVPEDLRLHEAAHRADTDMITGCITRLHSSSEVFNFARSTAGWNPLHIAVFTHPEDILLAGLFINNHLIDVDEPTDCPFTPDWDKQTPLHLATMKGSLNMVIFLIYNGANVNARNYSNQTPADCALIIGRLDIFDVLNKTHKSVTI